MRCGIKTHSATRSPIDYRWLAVACLHGIILFQTAVSTFNLFEETQKQLFFFLAKEKDDSNVLNVTHILTRP